MTLIAGDRPAGDVAPVFEGHHGTMREALLDLRALILEVAERTPGVGPVAEALRWGQVSYLTPATKSGTTIRIAADDTHGGDLALYVNCQTSLVGEWRERYPELLYGGTRSVHFRLGEALPREALRHMIAMALTYHARKKGNPAD